MGLTLTIYDLQANFTWQKIHAHQFTTSEEADCFCAKVEGRWRRWPSVNHTHGHPVVLVSNDAGCFVMNFDKTPLLPTNERKPRTTTIRPR